MMSISFISEFFSVSRCVRARHVLALLLFPVLSAAIANARGHHKPEPFPATKPGEPLPRTAADRTGALETRDGLTLRLTADLGSVRIIRLEAGAAPAVRYSLHIETDAKAAIAQQLLDSYVLKAKNTSSGVEINGSLPPQAAHGTAAGAQFWIQFEVAIPPGYSVDVNTQAGDIETQDIGGTAALITQGGNIRTGRIGANLRKNSSVHPVARLDTQGGHIQAQDVAGDLSAFTAGGHINVGNVAGDASLKSGGGHVRAGRIGGRADLETDGGNITVGYAGSFVSVRTGGGQIDFGEVRGSVHAETGGGGIRIIYVAGPMEVESSGGSICLTRVAGKVQAATGDGTITAWINPDAPSGGNTVQLAGASQLSSRNGDIIVFLPRNLAANIEATIANGDERRIEADPALHLAFQTMPGNGTQTRATTVLNGGGAPLKLRTTGGKIRLQFLDKELALQQSLIRDQVERLKRSGIEPVLYPICCPTLADLPPVNTNPGQDLKVDWLERWIDQLEEKFAGGLREDPEEFQKRLTYHPKPSYPAVAQRVGVQGYVKLQVRILKDGRVEVMKLLEGDPELANAAMDAVKQWRGQPVWINGEPLEVISLVTFNFQLH